MSVRGILGRSWGEIPLSLRIFAATWLLSMAVGSVIAFVRLPLSLVVLPIEIALLLLLLRGSRVVWVVIAAGSAITLALTPWTNGWSLAWVPVSVVQLALLLVPSTCRFVWRPRPKRPLAAPTGQTTWHAGDQADPERPDGWYVDPANPRRMRYWRSELGEWVGSTAVPRKVAREIKRSEATPDPPGPRSRD